MFTRSALTGAALTAVCGLVLWGTPLGEAWENASYDYSYCFGSHAATNPVVFVQMEAVADEARRDYALERERHAALLQKLTDDRAALVVFDVFFRTSTVVQADDKLAEAMRRNGRVILMARIAGETDSPSLANATIVQPCGIFLNAAAGSGLGYADPHTGQTARRHWPFLNPGEGNFHSLGWVAAEMAGARLDSKIEKQWLRFYGRNGPGPRIIYSQALTEPPGFFRDKIIFIGGWPASPNDPGFEEPDKFSTPYTHWTGQAIGGVLIHATTFLNLVNGDWLRRPRAEWELLLLLVTGFLIGGGLRQLKPLAALLVAAAVFFTVMCVFVVWSYHTNYWFPWLVIAGGQVPFALAWAWTTWTRHVIIFHERFPGYAPVGDPVGEGAYGKVWLVRNATGELQALKEIQLSKFLDHAPYEREFRGIKSYKPFSNQHPGLLHIDHVNRNEHDGYFYYVMELADAHDAAWEQNGGTYQPRDLHRVCQQLEHKRFPARECLRLGISLLDALDFLHQRGLVHRDIKPANIVFVKDRPKLADVGLVREASPDATYVGTEFFMPPPPEKPGSLTADIYAIGKVLYVISTGNSAKTFPDLSNTLVDQPEFMRLNEIICRACQPAAEQRFASAAEMLASLRAAQSELDRGKTQLI